MAKAILTKIDMQTETVDTSYNHDGLVDISSAPITYSYYLTYNSYQPLNIAYFPKEIDTDDLLNRSGSVKMDEIKSKEIEKPNVKITNAIQFLELED